MLLVGPITCNICHFLKGKISITLLQKFLQILTMTLVYKIQLEYNTQLSEKIEILVKYVFHF